MNAEAAIPVLIADDDPVSRLILKVLVAKLGFYPVCVADGDEAWRTVNDFPGIKLFILDWIMPGLEGLEICRRLSLQQPARERFVVMISAKDSPQDLRLSQQAGAGAYLVKPVDSRRLAECLELGLAGFRPKANRTPGIQAAER